MLHTVDNKIHIIYPLNYSEEQIQGLIQELRNKMEMDYNINSIYLDTTDIAISLVFYFKELLESRVTSENKGTKNEFCIYLKEPVYNLIKENFIKADIIDMNIFNSENLKIQA